MSVPHGCCQRVMVLSNLSELDQRHMLMSLGRTGMLYMHTKCLGVQQVGDASTMTVSKLLEGVQQVHAVCKSTQCPQCCHNQEACEEGAGMLTSVLEASALRTRSVRLPAPRSCC